MFTSLKEKQLDKLFEAYIKNETGYDFINRLGMGSYGIAYLIEHRDNNKKFVLKRMKAKHRKKAKLREKFNQEIQLLNEVGLPNTPTVITYGTIKETPFFIMDFIDGVTLEQAIFRDGETFSIYQSVHITEQLLKLVVSMHDKGIIHRDLRIPNILLKHEELYLIDFGLSTYINTNFPMTKLDNPKKAENHLCDLYYIGHFLLFLLYSTYSPIKKRERSWQEELQLPTEQIDYIERLLLIKDPFASAQEALDTLQSLKTTIVKRKDLS